MTLRNQLESVRIAAIDRRVSGVGDQVMILLQRMRGGADWSNVWRDETLEEQLMELVSRSQPLLRTADVD